MSDEKFSRRQLLQTALAAAAVPATMLIARSANAAEPLTESDPTAKSFGYTTDAKKVNAKSNPTYKPGQHCANCIQFTAKAGAPEGTCAIFPGKLVKSTAWCKVWVLKPGEKLG